MTRVILIRHGKPLIMRGRCYGKLDCDLSEKGKRQAAAIAYSLEDEPISVVFSSPRLRAMQTAAPLAAARSLVVKIEDDFRELDFGAFEGMSYDEAARAHPDVYVQWMERPTEVEFPGGESWIVLRERVLAAYERILRSYSGVTVAIVAHGGPLRAILGDALGMPDANVFRLAQGYGGISVIQVFEGIPVVECMNR